MSLSTQIKNMISTPSDSQLLSIRIPTTTVNQLEELAQVLNKTRSELISTFIDGGLEELEQQLLDIRNEKSLENSIKIESNSRYFLLNTNYNNSHHDHYTMLENEEASAFYGNWKENITYLKEGDVVFLYQSGNGIVGYGYSDGKLIKRDHNGNSNEWYSRKLNNFVRLNKPLTAKACKDTTKSNFNFRMTMVSLSKEQGDALLSKLNNL
ncbi:CopG family ribbon-helix-helix protein [Shewanella halifaxensis]|uniref:CopG family ribbon-helix-helix protein n=1 Tax=Shewanella halifaxensis TaxID=271098 RepID=UPI000D59A7D9|nr:EVE domain-containing protein [Shewanella halifaxensis]